MTDSLSGSVQSDVDYDITADQCRLAALHTHTHLLSAVCAMLNEEWPRSTAARTRSLKMSSETPPTSLLLVHGGDCSGDCAEEVVVAVAHARLSPLPGDTSALLLESLVVQRRMRSRGLGRRLVELTEQYAQRRGYSAIYLSTHDRCGFYSSLGYSNCHPVVTYHGPRSSVLDQRSAKFLCENERVLSEVSISSYGATIPTEFSLKSGRSATKRENPALPLGDTPLSYDQSPNSQNANTVHPPHGTVPAESVLWSSSSAPVCSSSGGATVPTPPSLPRQPESSTDRLPAVSQYKQFMVKLL